MIDIDLMYVTYRQQELWHEAAAQALTAHVRPARSRWWTRVRATLTTLFSNRPCQLHAKSLPDAFLVRKADWG